MNQVIETIYSTRRVSSEDGRIFDLNSEVDREEGKFLYETILAAPNISKTLEVGCAFGLASLHICEAIRNRADAFHTIIDPFQNSQWNGIGIKHLKDSNVDYFRLIEDKSEFALPRLLEKNEGLFDFIFIDGWHTFDHTLVDCFFATRLLSIGGILVIDDVNMRSVERVVDFLTTYPCFELVATVNVERKNWIRRSVLKTLLLPLQVANLTTLIRQDLRHKIYDASYTTMIALRKIEEDHRSWDWHSEHF